MYKDKAQNQGLYHTPDYPQDYLLHSMANKKVLGKLKDECAGSAIAEFVGLRPKKYSILEASGDCIKKAKGVKMPLSKKKKKKASGTSSIKRLSS